MNELALFAGAGGGILGGHLLGWRTVAAVEIEDYPRRVLLQRQADGFLPRFPIWDDVKTFDGKPWRGKIDVISGGFPCQDISIAGGGGLDGARSGLWSEMARIICEVQPRYAFIENSPMLAIRGLDRVLCDLASLGFDARWGVLGADDIGANHERKRIWIVAKISNSKRIGWYKGNNAQLGSNKTIRTYRPISIKSSLEGYDGNNWSTEPNVCRMVNGLADTVDRLKAIGNGQVPLCAATAWRILSDANNI